MANSFPASLQLWQKRSLESLVSAISLVVFLFLDFLDVIMCIFFKIVDEFLEGSPFCPCYCRKVEEEEGGKKGEFNRQNGISKTLYNRKNLFRGIMGYLGISRFYFKNWSRDTKWNAKRWSDCGCESCGEWMTNGNDFRLHVVVKEPKTGSLGNAEAKETENVIFLHGFLSSSSFWTETVFPNLSANTTEKYRLFAVDLLGFGRSPKPLNCLYTIKDHIEMIEKSVISSYQLNTFHLVAHSMGCMIALALATKHIKSVKSIVLIAPPYFPSSRENASSLALERFAKKRVWPPLLLGSAFMSWYEHLGRCVCFIICRHHRAWECILRLVTGKRDLHFMIHDLTRHTHHSAWHSMHNVICGGANLMDSYLEAVVAGRAKMSVFHGDLDEVVPVECSSSINIKVPDSKLHIIVSADHNTVVLDRERDFTMDLESVWESTL